MPFKAQIVGSEYDGEVVEDIGPVLYMRASMCIDPVSIYLMPLEDALPQPDTIETLTYYRCYGPDGELYYVHSSLRQ